MKNLLPVLLAALSLLTACQSHSAEKEPETAPAPADNALTEAETAAGWKLLFDGASLNQWRSYNGTGLPKSGWVARDATLVIEKTPHPKPEGFGGDLITKDEFGNFELSLDFLLSDTANSGILYLAIEEKDSAIWHNAPEFQLIDNAAWAKMDPNFNMDTHRTGDNYDLQASAADHMKPVGQWNTARIIHNNGHVEHWLNGQQCLSYDINSAAWKAQYAKSKFSGYPQYAQAKKGYIGLQDHEHEVRFKNIKIRNL